MKKLFLIAAAMLAAVSFSACSDDDNKKPATEPIVGKWQLIHSVGYLTDSGKRQEYDKNYPDGKGVYLVYEFKKDGTGISYWNSPSADPDYNEPFSYSVSEKTLTITYRDDTPQVSHLEIKKLTSTDLILYENNSKAEFEDTSTYKRMQ
ncbi:lipocalin family protein [Alistipes sp.]|uniref:lipocalin family protein n=1 Tax=Alistipes sp. TaxID=1872444 RepID=UPI0025B92E45|nr:lipocalin family protein [Alistipes sp.]